jgi:hypothetical protein
MDILADQRMAGFAQDQAGGKVAIVILQLYVLFRLNYWNRDFFNALGNRDPACLLVWALLPMPFAARVSLSPWGPSGRFKDHRFGKTSDVAGQAESGAGI